MGCTALRGVKEGLRAFWGVKEGLRAFWGVKEGLRAFWGVKEGLRAFWGVKEGLRAFGLCSIVETAAADRGCGAPPNPASKNPNYRFVGFLSAQLVLIVVVANALFCRSLTS